MPEGAFGYVPTPALVAPIEFTLRASDYAALVLPGGVANPDFLRSNDAAVAFAKSFFDAGKPVAAICHGPWTLIEAGAVKKDDGTMEAGRVNVGRDGLNRAKRSFEMSCARQFAEKF